MSSPLICCAAPLSALVLGLTALGAPAGAQGVEYFNHAAFSAATARVGLVTFDELAPGNGALTTSQYAGIGLAIVQRDGLAMNVMNFGSNSLFPSDNFNTLPNVISSADGPGFDCPQCSDNFDFILSPPRMAAGLWIGNIHITDVQFLDASGAVIAQENFTTSNPNMIKGPGPVWNNRIFYGLVSSVPIATIRTVEPCCEGDGICYDDVQWADVPGVATYGASTPGCAGPLSIGVNGMPKIGSAAFAITCSNATPSSIGLLGVSTTALGAPIPVLGIALWIHPVGMVIFSAASNASGGVSKAMPIPNDAGLAGASASAQLAFPSPCGPQGFSASNALTLTFQP